MMNEKIVNRNMKNNNSISEQTEALIYWYKSKVISRLDKNDYFKRGCGIMTCFTVEELIEELKKYPKYASVYISKGDCSYSWPCQGVHDYDLDVDGGVTLTNEPG